MVFFFFFFFFSSRRRHTRLQGDWSSDVCSSDLTTGAIGNRAREARGREATGGSGGGRADRNKLTSVAGSGNERRLASRRELLDLRLGVHAIGERAQAHARPYTYPVPRGVREPSP